MALKKKTHAKLMKTLKRARNEHERLAEKVETNQGKLEKRTHKLQSLESKIAEWERDASSLGSTQAGQAPESDVNLRPARLIYNARSGGKNAHSLEEIVSALRAHGIQADAWVKTSGKATRKIAKKAVEQKQELVIVAGGDGTLEDAAMQLVGTKTALGILPIGTMNNVARSLGVPLVLDDACALLGAGSVRQIDVGRITTDEKPKGEYFLETAGLGLTVLAFPAGQAVRKKRPGILPPALLKLFEYKPSLVQIELDDGETIQANSELVTVSNAPLTGLNFLIAPDAKMDDGLLDIAVYDGMGKTEVLDYFSAMRDGKRAENSKVRFYRARKVRIHTVQSGPVVSDKDEIPAGQVLNIELIPQALTMVVGKGVGLNLPVDAVKSVPPLSGPQMQPQNGNGATKAVSIPNTGDGKA